MIYILCILAFYYYSVPEAAKAFSPQNDVESLSPHHDDENFSPSFCLALNTVCLAMYHTLRANDTQTLYGPAKGTRHADRCNLGHMPFIVKPAVRLRLGESSRWHRDELGIAVSCRAY